MQRNLFLKSLKIKNKTKKIGKETTAERCHRHFGSWKADALATRNFTRPQWKAADPHPRISEKAQKREEPSTPSGGRTI